ncbi:MAG TPA: RNA polymerase sigma factor [Desulfuromonadales bacterium]|nr:RNA polymerase sigma factor [Desulfuromonadales bacterium]
MVDVSPELSDESLVKAALAGDDTSFARLVCKHKRRVFGLAARFARNGDELEDICQETFIKVYEKLSTFRNEAPFENWLSRIAVRVCHDALRSRRHEKHQLNVDLYEIDVRDVAGESRQEVRQAREFLRFAMSKLSADEQLVITLLELEELSVRETAEYTGWSEANVKVRAFRARHALKKIVEEHDGRKFR